jgi:hypothetical protein
MAPREIHPTLRKSSKSNEVARNIMGAASITKWRKSFSDIWRKPLAAGVM